jgi:carbamoyltransferase
MATYVLGTHVSHDGSSCLLKDGQVLVAIEKERLTRVKHDGGNDNQTVKYCLDAAGIGIEDVDLVVQNANLHMFEAGSAGREGERLAAGARRVVTISHHLAHAYSAIGTAPFDDMAVLVIDGCGNAYADAMDLEGAQIPERPPAAELAPLYFEKDSHYHYRDGRCRTVWKDFSPWGRPQHYPMQPFTTMHSIGGAYNAASKYVFRGMEDPGKLMGLAPYGRPGVFDHEIFRLDQGRVFLNVEWMKHFLRPARDHAQFKRDFQYYADVAHFVQREIERALLYVVNHRYDLAPCPRLAYAGGVALNAVANRLIQTRTRFQEVYFQPAAGDNGLALGAACYGWLEVLGRPRVRHGGGTCFGRRYPRPAIREALDRHQPSIEYIECPAQSSSGGDAVARAAALLAEGKVIGWFQEGSEFGPRALGNRSILALPTAAAVKDFINANIKFREDFRPFAPSVLAEDAGRCFELAGDSPYMILVAPTRAEWRARIPAVVHRDGSARIQTVHRSISPRYHRLLEEVKRRTDLPVVLNTSLNRRGMPIVETPAEAVTLLLETALDALVIEDWLVCKRAGAGAGPPAAPPTVDELFGRMRAGLLAAAATGGLEQGAGVLQFEITGACERWTVDLRAAAPRVERAAAASPDHTVVIAHEHLIALLDSPGAARALYEAGALAAPGLGRHQAEAVSALLRRVTALASQARR